MAKTVCEALRAWLQEGAARGSPKVLYRHLTGEKRRSGRDGFWEIPITWRLVRET